jgi:anti-anti-sigma factor
MTNADDSSLETASGWAPSSLIVVHDVRDAAHVVNVFSEVDISTAPEFEAEVARADAERVVIELSDCRYMDTSGISVLTRAYRRLGGRLRIVVAPNSNVERVLRLLHLHSLLRIGTSLESALALTAADPAS